MLTAHVTYLPATRRTEPAVGLTITDHTVQVNVRLSPYQALRVAAQLATIGGVHLVQETDGSILVFEGTDSEGLRVSLGTIETTFDESIVDAGVLQALALALVDTVTHNAWTEPRLRRDDPYRALYVAYACAAPREDGSVAIARVDASYAFGVHSAITLQRPAENLRVRDTHLDALTADEVIELADKLRPLVAAAQSAYEARIAAEHTSTDTTQ